MRAMLGSVTLDQLDDRLKYELLTAVACIMSKTVSPTPRNLSATDLTVGSDMPDVSGLRQKC